MNVLQEDISDALDLPIHFAEHFCHHWNESSVPNPGLSVGGVGKLRLPFGDEDANTIRNHYVAAAGRSCWIDSSKVVIRNPNWQTFINNSLLPRLSKDFELPEYASKTATCRLGGIIVDAPEELRKVFQKTFAFAFGLMTEVSIDRNPAEYEAQSTHGPNTFAYVTIVLPSEFEGGKIKVASDNREEVIDVSHNAEFTTSVLAHFSDGASCTSEPLTSGYRLRLVYSFDIEDLPSIKDSLTSSTQLAQSQRELRAVLTKWKSGGYLGRTPSLPVIPVYIHEEDQQKALQVAAPVAEEVGFLVFRATARLHLRGTACDSEDAYERRRRRAGYDDYDDYYEDDDFIPRMGEVYARKMTVTIMKGDGVSDLEGETFQIEKDCLAPYFFDEGDEPDDAKYSGYYEGEVRKSCIQCSASLEVNTLHRVLETSNNVWTVPFALL